MSNKIKEVSEYDFPDRRLEADAYGERTVPEITEDNLIFIINKLNEIISELNLLKEK